MTKDEIKRHLGLTKVEKVETEERQELKDKLEEAVEKIRSLEGEVKALMQALERAGEFRAGDAVRAAFAKIRERVVFISRDRAMDADVRAMCELVAQGGLIA